MNYVLMPYICLFYIIKKSIKNILFMRLTSFSRFLITLLVAGALFFLIKTLVGKFGGGKTDGTTTEQTGNTGSSPTESSTDGSVANNSNSTNSNASSANADGNTAAQSNTARPAFNYTPQAPVNGKLRGVVELGASGFNSFIVRMDNQKNWKLENAEFGASLALENMATTDDVRSGLRKYIAKMVDFGVSNKDIHFVVSSGAAKEPSILKISDALKAMGYVVNVVTPEQEGKFALRCALPDAYRAEGFMVDIGSGNTKISWLDATGKIKGVETHGAKYFQKSTLDSQVYNDVTGMVSQVPVANRKVCFIIGGVPFELAKQDRKDKERYTTLRQAAQYQASGDKQKSGLNIYKAIADKTNCPTFVFDWDANFTIGFLLSL
jgi:hypothetical protein